MSEGNPNVILCKRGIQTFEIHTRNTLDLATVPALKCLSHFNQALMDAQQAISPKQFANMMVSVNEIHQAIKKNHLYEPYQT